MALDSRTAIALISIVFALQSVPLILVYLLANQYKGINYWLIGNVLIAVGYFLVSLRGVIIDFFSITIANIISILGLSLLGLGVSRFTQQVYPRYFILALNAIWLVIHLHFTYINDNIIIRIINYSGIGSIIFIFAAYQLLSYKDKRLIISIRFTAIVFLCSASLFLIRIIVVLLNNYSNPLFDNSLSQTLLQISYLIMSFLLTVGLVSMISQRLYEDLRTLAIYDFLTETLNRRAMQLEINKEIAYFNRRKEQFALILMDIDRFKSINDNYGHDCGDLVLQHFTRTIKNNIRKEDALGRWGGEEFLILSRGSNVEDALILAERLRSAIESEKVITGHTIIKYTLSLGVAVYGIHGTTQEQLVKAADKALYEAKNSGRNQVAIATVFL
ncbi:diguanylate cyclase [Gloeothece citriformis PCC 7424]|uniref:Diguanylate cyclase n=1 Tax=Gloeothece citriformis (strain PCC 7424) TaxID=65393 RepID=B7KBD9_GLOC7|nr:GGDEF domain-containing protein [Gloeothece citriformis]ACK71495.1 diguanylate cyclase [Gloeothece citriformis PCC 7424]